MGYQGGDLTVLFDATVRDETRRTMRRMVKRGIDLWQDVTTQNTPIDTGNLRTSWYVTDVKRRYTPVGTVYEARLETRVPYAPHVEWGTGLWGPKKKKYVIRPKDPSGFLRFRGKDGALIHAKFVMHPGSPGQHMVAIGGEVVKARAPLHLETRRLVAFIEKRAEASNG